MVRSRSPVPFCSSSLAVGWGLMHPHGPRAFWLFHEGGVIHALTVTFDAEGAPHTTGGFGCGLLLARSMVPLDLYRQWCAHWPALPTPQPSIFSLPQLDDGGGLCAAAPQCWRMLGFSFGCAPRESTRPAPALPRPGTRGFQIQTSTSANTAVRPHRTRCQLPLGQAAPRWVRLL